MVIWVANVTGFDHHTLMEMPLHELQAWHEQVLEFHEERLQEKAELLRESTNAPDGKNSISGDNPLKDFY